MYTNNPHLTDAQLEAEFLRCEYCEDKPCKQGCPADCSPADFIMAARLKSDKDFMRAAGEIMSFNPLGGICGAVCPDKHCMAKCVHLGFDKAIEIPSLQATVIERAKKLKVMPTFKKAKSNGKKVAVVGAGPAGLGTAAMLAQKGYKVTVFEAENLTGGACNTIPEYRLDKKILKSDIEFLLKCGDIEVVKNKYIEKPDDLLKKFDAVCVATGLWNPIKLGVKGEEAAVYSLEYLMDPKKFACKGNVAIIGGGAVAWDCAVTAKNNGAKMVEMYALETLSEMPLTQKELLELAHSGVDVNGRIKIKEITVKGKKVTGIITAKVKLNGKKFSLKDIEEIKGTDQGRMYFDQVIMAIGNRSGLNKIENPKIFYAGDCVNGPTTVVEAVAAGKNTAIQMDEYLSGKKITKIEKMVKSRVGLPGWNPLPVSLEYDFFGRKIESPFILSAAPPSDGYDQMVKAYEAGWAGGIMKTSFDGVQIHIPSQYMFAVTPNTYANCDNVSGHSLSRVCKEIKRLVKEYPTKLTMASTGGPVTGNDKSDKAGWQSNTKKLEDAGVMGIEYSLSCPQGGDGTEGDIVSQNAALTAKIIDWIMEISNPKIPKLFKLTAAVTSLHPIMMAIKKVLDKYPKKAAGVTLANTFPTLMFRKGNKKNWEEAIVVGMSGEGVTPISNLSLANVSKLGITVSGNGGPMNYKAAAHFLALGAKTVQFCTIAMKHGVGVYKELASGLSHLMLERGIKSVKDLVGAALPNPVTDFMSLTPTKKISCSDHDTCLKCGNCTRCPYMAITQDKDGYPVTDPEKCIGCSICSQKCFSGAITMRDRTKKELAMLKED
ncbi:MAG TPA: FAD-dependent oxidoreductase [Candidatus Wallbacteria bacterium]|nr:FAD-dependent oxidoreductase [Candidatus Wallbacteria bacterium]